MYALTPGREDPEAMRFFLPWALEWTRYLTWMSIAFPVAWVSLFLWIRWLLAPPKPLQHRGPGAGDDGSRFSRKAIWGAVWAPLAFGALIPMMLVETVVGSGPGVAPPPGVPPPIRILAGVLTIFGAAAPFGTTILGLIAISEIRRSAGKIFGLPLAVADMLLFPLLLLDGLIIGVVYFVVPEAARASLSPALLVVVPLLIVGIDLVLARAAWRAAAAGTGLPGAQAVEASSRAAHSSSSLRYRVGISLVIGAIYGGSFFLPTVWHRVALVDGTRSQIATSERPLLGWECFRDAWNHSYPSWYANPAIWLGCGFLACGGWRRATALGAAALILALSAYDGRSVYIHGFWWWMGAAALLTSASAYGWRRFDSQSD
jgi:hypothetical protein